MSVINLAVSAVEAAPAVLAGLQSVANAVETSQKDHATILETGTSALNAVAATLTNPGVTAIIGKNDAENIAIGKGLLADVEALAARLEVFAKSIW